MKRLLLALVSLGVLPIHAADWPSWLGPTQDGRSTGLGVAAGVPVGFDVAWKRALGVGYTGIAVAGERAVTMFADGAKDWVVAFDPRTGKELWRYEIDAMYPAQGGSEGGPASMPIVAADAVYGLGAQGHLLALRLADGKEIWKVRIDETLGGRAPRFGFATAPLVAGDVLFVQTGGDAGRSLAGFDRRTGKLLWSTGDDPAGYASPILATLGGTEQIVALTNRALYGLLPSSGKVLWTIEHGMVDGDEAVGTPVLIGADRFFVNGDPASKAFSVRKESESWRVEEAWSTRALKGSLATPVHHDGHLYGFDGDFLTCIRAEDGTKTWKSRPPGGRGLILVDGHLLILANDGAIVAVEATPAGYRETGRLPATAGGTWTYPSFANGLILVRNTVDLAAISVKAAPAAAAATATVASEPKSAFERFVRTVGGSAAKQPLVDEYMASQRSFPVVEEGWVHFLYRGPVEDVAITGSMTEWQVEEPLARLEGTDLFYRSYTAEPATRWEYRVNVDFENLQPDPLNPRRVPGREGEMSEVTTAGWVRSDWLEPYAGDSRGSIDSFTLKSEILGNERTVDVYLPAGYAAGKERHPLVVAIDGGSWRDLGKLPNVLDHVVGSRTAPVVVALVHQPPDARAEFGQKSTEYVEMLAEELMPELGSRYRIRNEAVERALLGAGSGGALAVQAALTKPGLFGKAAVTSPFLGPAVERVSATAAAFDASNPKPVFALTWSRNELHRADWNADIARDSRTLAETLEKNGFKVSAREAADSAGWGAWPVRAGEMLVVLFPRS